MTKEQLAEREFPHDPNAWGIDFGSVMIRRSDFIKGLEIGPKFTQWWWAFSMHEKSHTIEEAFELFLTEKYGTHEQAD
jgi:hypothetical protein